MALPLAQANIALPKEPLDSALLADFVARLDRANARAEQSPGFVGRLNDDAGDATAIRGFGDERLIINLSVWESLEALRTFVYRDAEHLAALRRRKEWFDRLDLAVALWWIPAGHVPTVAEAEERMQLLDQHGPTEQAFTFRQTFDPPDIGRRAA